MSLLATFMVPHPPLIIPEVGKGGEKQIEKTTKAYIKVAEEIATLKPDTIIISSPHAPYYEDHFYLSSSKIVEGSFAKFGVEQVKFTEEVDMDLVEEIEKIAKEKDFPVGNTPTKELDHGTMVPFYFIRKKLPKTKIVVVGLSDLSLEINYHLGMIIQKAITNINRKVVFIASGDLSHKLQEYGPYGFIKEGPIYDERIMNTMGTGNFGELLEYEEDFLEKVAQCGHRSFTIMAGVLDGLSVQVEKLSHEDITGVGYGICTFHLKERNPEREFLNKYQKKEDAYIKLARDSLTNYILKKEKIGLPANLPKEMLEDQAGVFVSLHRNGSLRGCIGTILPMMDCIANEIINNAISAGLHDSRFSPITAEELDSLEVKVDVLMPPEDIDSEALLDPKNYGVIVSQGYKRGLLLPDLEGIDTISKQIDIAKRKAGITEGKVKLQRFKVIRHQ